MRGINKVTLIGRLGKDPEAGALPSGKATTKFSMATSEKWRDKHTGETKEATEWHQIVAFDRLAEVCNQYLEKGMAVYVEGKLRTRKWEDREGVTRYTTEIVANQMQMLGGGSGEQREAAEAPRQAAAPAAAPAAAGQSDFDDDIPF